MLDNKTKYILLTCHKDFLYMLRILVKVTVLCTPLIYVYVSRKFCPEQSIYGDFSGFDGRTDAQTEFHVQILVLMLISACIS